MKKNKKLLHFLSFALVNIFLMNTCLQTLASEMNMRHSKISQHQTAKKADTPVVEEDENESESENENENERERRKKNDHVSIGDYTFFVQSFLIAEHQFAVRHYTKTFCMGVPQGHALFLKHRMIRI